MITNQIMVRDFDGHKIEQRTKDKFFNATQLLAVYNSNSETTKRFADFWINQNTKEFCEALENELLLNVDNSQHLKIYETSRGKGGATWMHPYLFIKFAFWLSPVFEVKMIKWIYDNLIDFRLQAGDYYKEMCETIVTTYESWYGKNPEPLVFIKEANYLNLLVFGSTTPKQRNEASEYQLALMNNLQKLNISLMGKSLPLKERKQQLLNFVEVTNSIDIVTKKIGIR